VVVDGASTDETPSVIAGWEDRHGDRVRSLRNEEPEGLATARNRAAGLARDVDYYAFLDDDDRWHPSKIERQLEAMADSEEDVDVTYTGLRAVTDAGEVQYRREPDLAGDIRESLLRWNVVGTPSTVVVARSAFERVGGFDESLEYHEDWDLYLRLARDCRFGVLRDPLVTKTVHDGAMSNDLDGHLEYRERVLEKHGTALREQGLAAGAWALHHRHAGTEFCRAGETARARAAFRKSLGYERHPTVIARYLLTWVLPGRAVQRVSNRAQSLVQR
jgi:glycosyltransferase involved in cell wall biosynthesis